MSSKNLGQNRGDSTSKVPPTLFFLIEESTLEPGDVALPTDDNLRKLSILAKELKAADDAGRNFVIIEKPNPMANPLGFLYFTQQDMTLAGVLKDEVELCRRDNLPLSPLHLELIWQLLKRIAGTSSGKELTENVQVRHVWEECSSEVPGQQGSDQASERTSLEGAEVLQRVHRTEGPRDDSTSRTRSSETERNDRPTDSLGSVQAGDSSS